MSSVYDLIVIGSGPAGQRAAIYAAKLGKKVALVEMREVVGGACINTGTIPSKTMREAVLHLSGYNYKSIYGMNYRVKERITMADLAFRVQHVIKTEVDVTEAQLSRNNDSRQSDELPRLDCVRSEECSDWHGNEASVLAEGADQWAQHHQQRPGTGPGEPAEDDDYRGRRRHWCGVYLHVFGAWGTGDADRAQAAVAGVCRPGDR